MRRLGDTKLYLIVISAIAAAVCVLGFLQYRWTTEISTAEQQRLTKILTKSVRQFDQQFAYDFERLGESFEIDPTEPADTIDARILARYVEWQRSTTRPDLLAGVYVWRADGGRGPHLETLDRQRVEFQSSGSLNDIPQLKPDFEKQFAKLPSLLAGHDAVYYPWTFRGDAVALVRPLFRMMVAARDSDMQVEPIGFLVIAMDAGYLRRHYFPELIGDELAASGFRVAVRNTSTPFKAIYSSDPTFPISTNAPDAAVNLLSSVGEEAKRRGHAPVNFDRDSEQWQLVAQHSSGSLEGAVTRWRDRNFAVSLALLLILSSCVGLVFSLARRAERLGKFQMQFVAGISHELCTPLTVINSIVENVADDVVSDAAQAREYAAILRNQSGRLSRLLDQVLLLATEETGKAAPELRPLDVGAIVAQTIAASEVQRREERFTLEKDIPTDLPTVIADPVLLAECVENLINNAMKYAGDSGWISVRAREFKSPAVHEVQVSVEDRGIGIARDDLSNIFEPFYRVRSAVRGRERGAGLGLYLVKRMVDSMGGRVSVASRHGEGSCFVLHFPVARTAVAAAPSQISSPSAAG
jgi:signal transduction histidine kinase